MGTLKDITGMRFGRLICLERVGVIQKHITWRFKCDCGKICVIPGYRAVYGLTQSCGCYRREVTSKRSKKHGMRSSPIYSVWFDMLDRCRNKNSKYYNRYGGRGIQVCEQWKSFENFINDMGNAVPSGKTLGRINNNKGYSPENCRWESIGQQARNRANNRLITYKGETKTLIEWSEILGVKYQILVDRIGKLGWSVSKAFTAPFRYRGR